MSRRTLLKGGGAALAGLSALRVAGGLPHAFPGGPGEQVLPWLDQPTPVPFPGDPKFLKWERSTRT